MLMVEKISKYKFLIKARGYCLAGRLAGWRAPRLIFCHAILIFRSILQHLFVDESFSDLLRIKG